MKVWPLSFWKFFSRYETTIYCNSGEAFLSIASLAQPFSMSRFPAKHRHDERQGGYTCGETKEKMARPCRAAILPRFEVVKIVLRFFLSVATLRSSGVSYGARRGLTAAAACGFFPFVVVEQTLVSDHFFAGWRL